MAEEYLVRNGYKLLFKNWTCRWGEIDLVMQKGQKVAFVEVKFRSSTRLGYPHQSVTRRKLKVLSRTITMFMLKEAKLLHNLYPSGSFEVSFGVVQVIKTGSEVLVSHFENVPL